MPLDHSEAFVKFTLEGLFVVCKNDRIGPPNRWEIGLPTLPRLNPHDFSIKIYKITGDGTPELELESSAARPDPRLDVTRDIEVITNIESIPAPHLGLSYYQAPNFDGPQNQGDPEDYRWIVDLEGRNFHNGAVEARTLPHPDHPDATRHYKAKVFIDGGILYTAHKSVERYKRVRHEPPQDELVLGKVALAAGIDLPRIRDDVFTFTVRNVGTSTGITLTQKPGIRYEVELKHVCPPGNPGPVPDFVLFYLILKARDNTRFNILRIPPPGTPPLPGGFGGDEPQVCNVMLLSQSLQPPGT
jgi:hypothetical protein